MDLLGEADIVALERMGQQGAPGNTIEQLKKLNVRVSWILVLAGRIGREP